MVKTVPVTSRPVITAGETEILKLFPLCNRAVANGPVGPAMAGPIIEPANFLFIIFFYFIFFTIFFWPE